MKTQRCIFALVTLCLAACGGGGDDNGRPAGAGTTTYTGQAFDAALANATVRVLTLGGEQLAETTTDSQGLFSVEVPAGHPYLLFEAGQGSYTEQATGQRVHLAGETLTAVIETGGGRNAVSVNILSHVMAGRFLHDRDQVFDFDAPAMDEARTALQGYAQLDPTKTTLIDLSAVQSVTGLDAGARASLCSAAVSQFVKNRIEADGHTGMQTGDAYSSIAFAQTLYEDVRADGKLDGQGTAGQLTFGALNLESNTYRDGLALAMVRFVRSARNQSGIGVTTMLDYATHLSGVQNNSTAGLFSNQAPEPISDIAPTISNLTPEDQAPVFDTVQFTFDALDFAGLQSIQFTFGNDDPETTSNFTDPVFEVDTTAYPDGVHPVEVAVTNLNGVTTTETIEVIVSNEGTTISNLDPEQGDTIRGIYPFRADMHDPVGIDYRYFYIDDVQYTGLTQTGTGYARDIDTTALTDGQHEFRAYARNSVGAETNESVTFTVDNTAPTVSNYPVADGDYLEDTILFDPAVSDAAGVARATLTVDGTEVATGLHTTPYTLDSSAYDEGAHTVRFEAEDTVGNLRVIEDDLFVDNQPPTVEIYYPQDGHTAVSEFNLQWEQDDATGWGEALAEVVVGGKHYGYVSNHVEQRSININNRDSGWNEVRVIVTDASGKTAEDSIMVNFQPE